MEVVVAYASKHLTLVYPPGGIGSYRTVSQLNGTVNSTQFKRYQSRASYNPLVIRIDILFYCHLGRYKVPPCVTEPFALFNPNWSGGQSRHCHRMNCPVNRKQCSFKTRFIFNTSCSHFSSIHFPPFFPNNQPHFHRPIVLFTTSRESRTHSSSLTNSYSPATTRTR